MLVAFDIFNIGESALSKSLLLVVAMVTPECPIHFCVLAFELGRNSLPFEETNEEGTDSKRENVRKIVCIAIGKL